MVIPAHEWRLFFGSIRFRRSGVSAPPSRWTVHKVKSRGHPKECTVTVCALEGLYLGLCGERLKSKKLSRITIHLWKKYSLTISPAAYYTELQISIALVSLRISIFLSLRHAFWKASFSFYPQASFSSPFFFVLLRCWWKSFIYSTAQHGLALLL